MKEYNILVVCSANKGRSASYHAYMQHLLTEKKIDGINIDSAGVNFRVIEGFHKTSDLGAEPLVKNILVRQGITEIQNHKVKMVDREVLQKSDLVLTYNVEMRNQIREMFPDFAEYVMTVRGFILGTENVNPEILNVDDAYYPNDGKLYRGKIKPQTSKAYAKVCAESKRLAEKTLEKLLRKNE
ncbi:hypothetical protein HOL21_02705 [Candidatus Woesearchaeota archaeon]|jgi:protein-tyrosine-phosphatase|nr:hypothetical protein [Candidatus Woesearchaeota archaeon]MBT5397099.1 hypothetical protein [Candidatus Woesearchaeota archaeon]MBT6367355.1 hypothetical protein [Candidatus Woesearchaeota archaeon]MBT7762499.1 hypothetical protein [Candidatus Woesearchaeota archaeon]